MAASNARHTILAFHDQQYPHLYSDAALAQLIPGKFETTTASALAARLEKGCALLVSFHGPYFPKAAWGTIKRFLEQGGNIAFFGGMPFTHPVRQDGTVEPEQQTYTDALYLGPFFPITIPASTASEVNFVAAPAATFLAACPFQITTGQPGAFWSFYPKMTQSSDHPEDLGSAGPLDTTLTPLLFATAPSTYSGNIATPALLLDQRSGHFKGGRWLLSPWQPASEQDWLANAATIQNLIRLAAEETRSVEVRPLLACYQPGESPTLLVSARTPSAICIEITVKSPRQEQPLKRFELEIPASPILQETTLRLPIQSTAGLYRVTMQYYDLATRLALRQETGFWLWDEELVQGTRYQRLTAGRDYFYVDGQLFPIFGTTYMDSKVQRKFLYLPNPARWDNDFAEMKAAGINFVRTGIWTAWREYMANAGSITESALRALDAFVMACCQHAIQLCFTFFSFFPPLFEGENPWLDPRSLEGQQDFVTIITSRYANVELVSWDLINEPSFGDPKLIFSQRPIPHYDRFELAAFRTWLSERYTLDELQLRWRQTPAELPTWQQVMPPLKVDYKAGVSDNEAHHMLKVMDFTFFSQDMITQWASRMYSAIRASGSQTLVSIGQDEAGARPAPQFYAGALDYTTTHPWWNVDDLLWDMLMDKTLNKPNLIQETGVMLVRDVDMRPWRSEQEAANLLERKLVTGLIARGAGVVQWLWHINAYMTSDNENSIGLVRPDGSAKPELAAMLEFGRLVQALHTQLVEAPDTPTTWLVIPYAQWFVRPDLGINATRHALRVLGYDLGIIPQLVGEHQLPTLLEAGHHPQTIILPGVQTLSDAGWQALRAFAAQGATLLVSGVISRDQHNLSRSTGLTDDEVEPLPVSHYEDFVPGPGEHYQLAFLAGRIGYVKKAHNQLKVYTEGKGKVFWSGLPLELALNPRVTRHVYQRVLNMTERAIGHVASPLLLSRLPLKEGTLTLIVSESSSQQQVTIADGIQVSIAPNRAGAVILKGTRALTTFGGVSQ